MALRFALPAGAHEPAEPHVPLAPSDNPEADLRDEVARNRLRLHALDEAMLRGIGVDGYRAGEWTLSQIEAAADALRDAVAEYRRRRVA